MIVSSEENQPLPPDLREKLRVPKGWFAFGISTAALVAEEPPSKVLVEVVAGLIAYRVERDSSMHLRFYRSTPGTGTRVAVADLAAIDRKRNSTTVILEWSPSVHRLRVGENVVVEGVDSARKLRVATDGSVVALGDEGLEVIDVTFFVGGRLMLRSTAIETWRATYEAIQKLASTVRGSGHDAESVAANFAIVMLASGLEAYARRRFGEIEQEGVPLDSDRLATKLLPAKRRGEILAEHKQRAVDESRALADLFAEATDMGNYDRMKTCFAAGFGIRFGEDLGISSQTLKAVQAALRYRNHLVHVSPLALVLDEKEFPNDEKVVSSDALLKELVDAANEFVHALHQRTVALGEGVGT